jgi:hypothetical protein
MKFRVEAWDPEYGSSVEHDAPTDSGSVVVDVERPAGAWAPVPPARAELRATVVLFVDGVRRTDAYGWIDDDVPCAFASFAAGVVRCDGAAAVGAHEIGRVVVSAAAALAPIATSSGEFRALAVTDGTPEQLNTAIQAAMTAAEVRVSFSAREAEPDALVVVDGPLRERRHLTHAVGLVKRHHVRYLGELDRVVAALRPGERTPVYLIPSQWGKYSWYLRLPGPDAGPWSGVVRIEAPAELAPGDAIALADRTSATLPRFASAPHKDGRAPQNLYPIGGLERTLRHRLGDPALVVRSLRAAAATAVAAAR